MSGRAPWFDARQGREGERCPSTSPIYKFDEGPRQCRGAKGHKGDHWALTSDGRRVDPQYDYGVSWAESQAEEAAE